MTAGTLPASGPAVRTMVDLLRANAEQDPGRTAFSWADDPGPLWTTAGTDERARAVAATLQDQGAAPGDRVLLLYPPGLNFVAAFLGCLYAGACPVPCSPPSPARRAPAGGHRRERFVAVAADASATTVLTTGDQLAVLGQRWRESGGGDVRWLATDALPAGAAEAYRSVRSDPHALALLQYTSGSTGSPRGVAVDHANLLHDLAMIGTAARIPVRPYVVSWMPVYHDMGLIGFVLGSQYFGGSCRLLSPLTFLRDPGRWLEEISAVEDDHVVSGSPDFGYALAVERVGPERRERLDLSRWSVAFNGAEPIRAQTLRSFATAFGPAGFRADSFLSCYGLAEATLLVAGHQGEPSLHVLDAAELERGRAADAAPGAAAADRRVLVGCGSAAVQERLVVVDPDTARPRPEGTVGEIWIAGANVAHGYHRRDEDTAKVFGARLADGTGPFLRTGDLGTVRAGELLVTGRLKDLIIVRGRNLYPQDLEHSAAAADPACGGPGAAFTVSDADTDRLVVVQPVRSRADLPAVAAAVRAAVTGDHDIEVDRVVLVRPAAVPRTTSGKVRRSECRARLADGRLEPLHVARLGAGAVPTGTPEQADAADPDRRAVLLAALLAQVSTALRVDPADLDAGAPLTALGLDSLRAMQLRGWVEDRFGVPVPMENLSLGELADLVLRGREQAERIDPLPPVELAPDERHEPFPLTEVQHAYFLGRSDAFPLGGVATHAYQEWESADLDVPRLSRAWQRLVERHPMLRAVVLPDGRQQVLPVVPGYRIAELDLAAEPADAGGARLAAVRERLSHEVRPPDRWPLFELVAAHLPGGRVRLHLSIDLLVGDLSSFRVLLAEWETLYRDPEAVLPALELTFRDYLLADRRLAGGPRHRRAEAYWRERGPTLPPAPELPLAVAPDTVRRPRFARRTAALPAELWDRIRARAAGTGVTPSAVLLTAYAHALAAWSASPRFTLTVTLSDRRPLHPEVDRVVGDFTAVTLLEVEPSTGRGVGADAIGLQRQLWRDLEHREVGGLQVLRDLAGAAATALPVVFTSGVGAGDLSGDWLGEPGYAVSQTSQVWLDHQVTERAGGVQLTWDAVEELFPTGLLDAMFDGYVRYVRALADDEDPWSGGGWDWLPARQRAVRAGLETRRPTPPALLHEAFLARAAAEPDRTAVIAADRAVGYGELARRATALARTLRALGAAPNTTVAICVPKGWQQVVAAVATLVAGAAYVPVDPSLPARRRGRLVEASRPVAVLVPTVGAGLADDAGVADGADLAAGAGLAPREELAAGEGLAGGWPGGTRLVAVPGADDRGWQGPDGDPLPPAQEPDDLAYVIYTSGSTGDPKGAMLSHRAAWNTVSDVLDRYAVTAGDRLLGLSSLSFDLSVFDVFGALARGAALVLPEPGASRDPQRWVQLAREHGVTVWNSVPAVMEMFVEQAESAPAGGDLALRLVLLSGDWIPLPLAARVRRLCPGARVVGLGGATEAAIWSNHYDIGDPEPGWPSVPYGYPLADQTFRVVDERLRDRPDWVPGELVIGGVGVADGYWRDPERTAQAFLTTPDGGRLYRTGDAGRYRPDGRLEFLGRRDLQVKVNGFRIELEEIEAALLRQPGVTAAAVVTQGDGRRRRLAAFAVRTGDRPDYRRTGQLLALDGADVDEVIEDPVRRLEFTLDRPGRRDAGDRPVTPLPGAPAEELRPAYERGGSVRELGTGPVSLAALGGLLAPLRGLRLGGPLPKYRYASAGSLYPVQVYVVTAPGAVEGLPAGAHHFDPEDNRLVHLGDGGLPADLHVPANRALAERAGLTVLLVGRTAAIRPLYGPLSRDFCLLEAGALSQLLRDAAPGQALGLCPVGALVGPDRLAGPLDLDPGDEVLHALLAGPLPTGTPVPAPAADPGGALRDALAGQLPAYMVPATVTVLPALPLTANGKVDRRALAERTDDRPVERPVARAATELETTIARVVGEVLGLAEVDVETNLLDLGANSVDVGRAHSRLQTELDRPLRLVRLFEYPTVRLLAGHLAGDADDTAAAEHGYELADRRRRRRASRSSVDTPKGNRR